MNRIQLECFVAFCPNLSLLFRNGFAPFFKISLLMLLCCGHSRLQATSTDTHHFPAWLDYVKLTQCWNPTLGRGEVTIEFNKAGLRGMHLELSHEAPLPACAQVQLRYSSPWPSGKDSAVDTVLQEDSQTIVIGYELHPQSHIPDEFLVITLLVTGINEGDFANLDFQLTGGIVMIENLDCTRAGMSSLEATSLPGWLPLNRPLWMGGHEDEKLYWNHQDGLTSPASVSLIDGRVWVCTRGLYPGLHYLLSERSGCLLSLLIRTSR